MALTYGRRAAASSNGRAAPGIGTGGTRKHLAPRARTARAFAFNRDAENPVVPRRAASIGRSGHSSARSVDSAAAMRSPTGAPGRQATPQSCERTRLSVGCLRPGFLPRATSLDTSCPAPIFAESPCRQLPNLSIQPSTVHRVCRAHRQRTAPASDRSRAPPSVLRATSARHRADTATPRQEHRAHPQTHPRSRRPVPNRPLDRKPPVVHEGRTFSITTRR